MISYDLTISMNKSVNIIKRVIFICHVHDQVPEIYSYYLFISPLLISSIGIITYCLVWFGEQKTVRYDRVHCFRKYLSANTKWTWRNNRRFNKEFYFSHFYLISRSTTLFELPMFFYVWLKRNISFIIVLK